MPARLDHTIVPSRDKARGARFLADLLGLSSPQPVGHFMAVRLANGVTLDYDDAPEVRPGHYAFAVSEEEFDAIFERVRHAGIAYFADPGHRREGEVNAREGGRGFYLSDPDGHNLEVLTRAHAPG